ncbi:MAG TPA: efflux RND transporter permease subunit [Candidatus Eisenbacteria bacterium]|nr:efflux RND transporter permease subunit [Candidatus Eisenbacteria bacterium]
MNLSRWALRYPVTASMVLVSIVAIGLIAAPKLPLAFLPEVDFPGLEVNIPYPNALPAQVEEEITRPAEEALATLSRVRRISSFSSNSSADINMEFDWGEDIAPLRVEAREKLERIRDQLPPDIDVIQVNSFRSSDIPVLECRVSAQRDLSRDYELLNRHIADPLRRVPGVAKVELYGVERPQIAIEFRLDDLRRHGIDAGQLLQRLDDSNRSASVGQIRRGNDQWPLRTVNQFTSLDDIKSFPVDDKGLKLADVATVAYQEPDLDYGRHLNESRAIGLNVIKESGANTVHVARAARKVLDEIGEDPTMKGIQVLTFTDQGEEITNSLKGLLEAGIIGAILAVIVLFIFLRSAITTLVVAAAIPFSLCAAAALLYFTGRSLNILSMMGLMLAVGMLVDNAVVVLESIYRHREKGHSRLRAALAGSQEVLPAVVAATGTSIIVFLPLVLGGRTEITTWIGEVGRTIIFTLVCSLFLSLTAIPLAMGRALPTTTLKPSRWIARLSDLHQKVLEWTLRHRVATAGIALGIFATAVAAFIPVDKSSFTASKVEAVLIRYEFTDNVNYREAEKYCTKVEQWIQARKDSLHVKSTYSYFGNNTAFTRAYLASGYADDDGANELRKKLREHLPPLAGAKLQLGGNNDDGEANQFSVRLFGEPGPRLDQLGEEVQRRLALVPGLTDLHVGGERGREEIEVTVDRDRAARYGLSASDAGRAVAMFFRGRPLARFRGPEGEVEMEAKLAESDRSSLDGLNDMPIRTPRGVVPLGALAAFQKVRTPSSVERQMRHTVLTVTGNVDPKKTGEIRRTASRTLNAMNFPTGYTWSYGRGFEQENATQQELLMNLVLALLLVYLVMASLFESLLHPFAIMLALPFAFVGIAWMCLLTKSPFNLMAQIGLLILIGIVVNNGIVLIYRVHQLRMGGMPRREAILEAARVRLRPILMTVTATVLGLAPLAVGQNHVGDVLYFPLARTVIGGLLASAVLTLVLVPCLYTLLEDGAALFAKVWKRGPRAA